MTIAVIWQEDGYQWCAADTRLVAGRDDAPTTEIATKIHAIPVAVSALSPEHRPPHYWAQYGFVYAGAALPASMTAVTASTLLQKLARPGDPADPPTFEQIAELVHRLAKRFMQDRLANMDDRHRFESDGLFSAAFFGWCPHTMTYKIAHIVGRNDAGSFRVELSYPPTPPTDGDPWLVLGSAEPTFRSTLAAYRSAEGDIIKLAPGRVIAWWPMGLITRWAAPRPSARRINTASSCSTRLSRSHPVKPRRVGYSMDWIWTPKSGQSVNTPWQPPAWDT